MDSIRFLFLFLIAIAAASCSRKSETMQKLEQIDAMLYEEQDSMAYSLLNSIESEDLDTPEKEMYYNMLKTGLKYRMGDRSQNDSVINKCVDFYEKSGNKEKLAMSYFYRALVNWYTYSNNVLLDLIKAETHAKYVNSLGLLSKIYSAIAIIYSVAEEDKTALKYILKSVGAAEKSGKEWLLVYAYIDASSIYKENNNQDSAFYYAQKCEAYVEDLSPHYKSYVYYNLGTMLVNSNDSLAEDYLKKALEYNYLPQAYKSLADIYIARGKREFAAEMWNNAIKKAWPELKAEIFESKAATEYGNGEYAECCKTLKEREKELTKFYESRLENKTRELENKYNLDLLHHKIRTRMVLTGIVLISLILLHRIRVRRVDNRRMKAELDYGKAKSTLAMFEERIAVLESDKKSKTKELSVLKEKAGNLKNEMRTNLQRGHDLYDKLKRNESPTQWTDNDYLCLFDFVSTIDQELAVGLEVNYGQLSNDQKLFLIIDNLLKKDDNEICQMLGLEKQSLRNKRSRIAKKRVIEN